MQPCRRAGVNAAEGYACSASLLFEATPAAGRALIGLTSRCETAKCYANVTFAYGLIQPCRRAGLENRSIRGEIRIMLYWAKQLHGWLMFGAISSLKAFIVLIKEHFPENDHFLGK